MVVHSFHFYVIKKLLLCFLTAKSRNMGNQREMTVKDVDDFSHNQSGDNGSQAKTLKMEEKDKRQRSCQCNQSDVKGNFNASKFLVKHGGNRFYQSLSRNHQHIGRDLNADSQSQNDASRHMHFPASHRL